MWFRHVFCYRKDRRENTFTLSIARRLMQSKKRSRNWPVLYLHLSFTPCSHTWRQWRAGEQSTLGMVGPQKIFVELGNKLNSWFWSWSLTVLGIPRRYVRDYWETVKKGFLSFATTFILSHSASLCFIFWVSI